MNNKLFYEFLEKENLIDKFNDFVKSKQINNLKYVLDVMIGDADFYLDMSFIITKDDKEFLKEWSKTIRLNKVVFATGHDSSLKFWRGEMLQNLFNDHNGYLEGEGYCLGTSYDVETTDEEPGDVKRYIYDQLCEALSNEYKKFGNELMKLFVKTSFYKLINEEEE